MLCPHCKIDIGELAICPSCKTLLKMNKPMNTEAVEELFYLSLGAFGFGVISILLIASVSILVATIKNYIR